METVFADTSGLYAALVEGDGAHAACAEAFRGLGRDGTHLVSTSFVLHETVALLQARVGLAAVRRFHDELLPLLDVAWIEAGDYERAVEAFDLRVTRV